MISDDVDEITSFNDEINHFPQFDLENTEINTESVRFSAKLYELPDISQKKVNDIIFDASELLKKTIISVQGEICSHFKKLGMTDQDISEVETIFNKFSEPFQQMKTEKQRLAHFQYYDSYIPPQSYQIGHSIEYKSAPTGTKRKDIPVMAQFIPIRVVLKKFFELPSIFEKTIKYFNILDSQTTIITNIYQSFYWKQKTSHQNINQSFKIFFCLFCLIH